MEEEYNFSYTIRGVSDNGENYDCIKEENGPLRFYSLEKFVGNLEEFLKSQAKLDKKMPIKAELKLTIYRNTEK